MWKKECAMTKYCKYKLCQEIPSETEKTEIFDKRFALTAKHSVV